jgi:hypothetical protein
MRRIERVVIWVSIVLFLGLSSVCFTLVTKISEQRHAEQSVRTATTEAEQVLNFEYGAEVKQIVEGFELQRHEGSKNVEATRIRVIEYTQERFKAYAAVKIKSGYGLCGIYVFLREDEVWQFATFFPIMRTYDDLRRDWDQVRDGYVGYIDELPQWEPCEYTRW